MEAITQNEVHKMALEYIRKLTARGYSVTRAGLNFKVVTSLGAVTYMSITELEELANKRQEFVL